MKKIKPRNSTAMKRAAYLLLSFMTGIMIIAFASLIVGCIHKNEVKPDTVGNVFRKAAVSSVVIETNEGMGSGTVIGKRDGMILVLTCFHVLSESDPSAVQVKAFADDYAYTYQAHVDAVDPVHDLALIIAVGGAVVTPMPIAAEDPPLYAQIYVIGSPIGLKRVATVGVLSSKHIGLAPLYMVSGAFVLFGISGGTVTNGDAELIGVPARVLSFGNVPLPQAGFFIPLEQIKAFIKPYRLM